MAGELAAASSGDAQHEPLYFIPSIRRANPFDAALETFLDALEALDEVVSTLSPRAKELDTPERRTEAFRAAIRTIPVSRRSDFRRIVEEVEEQAGGQSHPGAIIAALGERLGWEHWISELHYAFYRGIVRPDRLQVLLRLAVAGVVTAFEVLVGALVGEFYNRHPGALGSGQDEPRFSLRELQDVGDLEAVRQMAINDKVDRFLRESADAWSSWFKKHLGFALADCTHDWGAIIEFVERRHIVVHANGRVSRQYRERLRDSPHTLPPEGAQLLITDAYLRSGIDHFIVVGVLATTLSWVKLDKDSARSAVLRLTEVVYDLLRQERWHVTELLCKGALKLRLNESLTHIFRCNLWLSRKRLGHGLAERDEIERWDTTALDVQFRVVQLSLLDEIDSAMALLRKSLDSIGIHNVCGWPILAEVRRHPDFAGVIVSYYKSRHPDRDVDEHWDARDRALVVVNSRADRYHRPKCASAKSGLRMPVGAAKACNFQPCARCDPPK